MPIYLPEQLTYPRAWIEKPGFLIDPYIPAKSKVVLLHGPGGVGKSALLWSLANAIESGVSLFGLPVRQAKTLVISTDMSLYELNLRWQAGFVPLFPLAVTEPFDITSSSFSTGVFFKECRKYVEDNHVEVVFIDTLGKIHFRDARFEETVALVYQGLNKWFPQTTILGNFHNRKAIRDLSGQEIISEDDFRGNRKWVDDAVSQLHMRKVNNEEFHSQLLHMKNQVGLKADPIELYIDIYGQVELWDTTRFNRVVRQYAKTLSDLPSNITVKAINDAYCEKYNVHPRHAKRVRAMYLNSQKKPTNTVGVT